MTIHSERPTEMPRPQGEPLLVSAPATGREITTLPTATITDLDAAVNQAVAAQIHWSQDDQRRREILHQLADLTVEHAHEIEQLVAKETGKPLAAASIEPVWAADHIRWIADVELPEEPEFEAGGEFIRLERTPVGVVGAIVPWNVPAVMAIHKFAAAARMGNTVIVKPSPFTPLATKKWGELAQQVLPEGVLNVVIGHDDVGRALVAHPDVDMIGFTGSTATGRAIMHSAADQLKPLALELGGNDAAIVLPDASVDQIAEGLFMGAFMLSGQVCQSIKRLYVHRSQYVNVGEKLAEIARAQVLGGPDDPDATFGPLVTAEQRDRVATLVDDARQRGARIVTGGLVPDRPGYYYEPTIVMDVPDDARLVMEEQFGPALPILVYDDIEEVLQRANSSDFGLGGSVWTTDVAAGVKLARRLEAGSVWVNAHATIHPAVSFGGVKQSGLGREGGIEGLLGYTEQLTVHLPTS